MTRNTLVTSRQTTCMPANLLMLQFESRSFQERYKKANHLCVAKHTFARKCIRYSLPNLINETPSDIIDKVFTHSVNGFKLYVKKCIIVKYSDTCHIVNCYICNQN